MFLRDSGLFGHFMRFDNIITLFFRVYQDLSREESQIVDVREREALKKKYTKMYQQEKKAFIENLR